MLQLGHTKLQLVQIVACDEVQILDEAAQQRRRLLPRPGSRPAHACGKLAEQLLEDFDDSRAATGHGRAASSGDAGGASRDEPARTAPTATR